MSSIDKVRVNNIDYDIGGGGETLPVGSEIDYDGNTVPTGWEETTDPSVYSTTEKRIGTWIDGKPLYRKTYYLKDVDIPKANKVLLDFSDLNAETAFLKDDMSFWIDVSSTSTHTPMSVHLNQIISGTTDWQSTWLWDNKVYTRCGMVRKEDIYMTLEYTKTTD